MIKLFTSRSLAVYSKLTVTSLRLEMSTKPLNSELYLVPYASIDNDHTYCSRCKVYFKHTENTDHKNIFEMALRLIIAAPRLSFHQHVDKDIVCHFAYLINWIACSAQKILLLKFYSVLLKKRMSKGLSWWPEMNLEAHSSFREKEPELRSLGHVTCK